MGQFSADLLTNIPGLGRSAETWIATLDQLESSHKDMRTWKSTKALKTALGDVRVALLGLHAAKLQAARILSDPRLSQATKLQEASALVRPALAAAWDANRAYTAALTSAKGELKREVLPKPPASADAMLAFQAEQTTKLLEAQGNSAAVMDAASVLLRSALDRGDSSLAYLLAGADSPLQLVYSRLGVSGPEIEQRFGWAIAQQQAATATPESPTALLQELEKGGSGTLAALSTITLNALMSEQESAERNFASWALASTQQQDTAAPTAAAASAAGGQGQ